MMLKKLLFKKMIMILSQWLSKQWKIKISSLMKLMNKLENQSWKDQKQPGWNQKQKMNKILSKMILKQYQTKISEKRI